MVGASLTRANLSNSNLRSSDLSHAMLVGAVFNDTDLRGAILHDAELALATLSGVQLTEADLTGAHLSKTVFARCHDLHRALGLDSLSCLTTSSIDLETLRVCLVGLPDQFLEAVGVEPREYEALRGAAGVLA
jgi:uncharacterized protein YjbI with pentapeptide repeats